jgi:GNAT superfamily N-acetyltransferase
VSILVRPARAADAAAMSDVLTASITELCAADHGNDPGAIAAWTANKTPHGVGAMLASPDTQAYVAERQGGIVGVGAISRTGMVTLNYVSPEARYTGVSKALFSRLESELLTLGHREGRLEATATAIEFYRRAGWIGDGPQAEGRRVNGFPMRKLFTAEVRP